MQVVFRRLPVSPAVVERVEREAQKLWRYADAITHCHVMIVAPHRHHLAGRRYAMHLEIGLPGKLIVITHEPATRSRAAVAEKSRRRTEVDAPAKDIYLVIRKVFDVARRRLQDRVRRTRERRCLGRPPRKP